MDLSASINQKLIDQFLQKWNSDINNPSKGIRNIIFKTLKSFLNTTSFFVKNT